MDLKKRRKQERVNNISKVAIDLGKLTFASMVLGSVISFDISKVYILLIGGVVSVSLVMAGIFLTQPKEKED